MADVRSLLKAKRQEARISHPYATYTPSDQLKCSICSSIIKHASAWEGHLGSKAHRMAVARMRQAELEAAAAAASLEDHHDDEDEEEDRSMSPPRASSSTAKRKASISSQDLEKKKRRTAAPSSTSGFPADFFSDASRQVPIPGDDDEDDAGMAIEPTPAAAALSSIVDAEYEQFQRELLKMQAEAPPLAEAHEMYSRATITGEEELFTEQQKSGFEGLGEPEEPISTDPVQITEEQKRQRDRELIMDRLLEEERLQEDADMRVASMKARMDALKKKRELRKAAKGTTT